MGELALGVRSGALVPLELPADLQLEPARVLAVQQVVHVNHSHRRQPTVLVIVGGYVGVLRGVENKPKVRVRENEERVQVDDGLVSILGRSEPFGSSSAKPWRSKDCVFLVSRSG